MNSSDTPKEPEALLEALDAEQQKVVQQISGPLCVLAGAGTGKTRAITHRIAYGAATGKVDPSTVLALTFTARAANEMRNRLRDLGVAGVQAQTFHAAALRQLSFFWPTLVGGNIPQLMTHKASLISSVCGRLNLDISRTLVRDIAAEIEWTKVSLISPDEYEAHISKIKRVPPTGKDTGVMVRALKYYEDAKEERGVIDFEDVLLLTVGMLSQREDIAREIRSQYRSFVVDEYQDVSPLQQALLDQWLGDRHNICVVGDVAQTIYSFTGATADFLTSFSQTYPGAHTVTLKRDYRSTPQIVNAANKIIFSAPKNKQLRGAVELVSQCPAGPEVSFDCYEDDIAEAEAVATQIKQLAATGVPLSQIAVLHRINDQSPFLEEVFAREGISYLIKGGQQFFSRDEIRRARVSLRTAARSGGNGTLIEIVKEAVSPLGWSEVPPESRGAARERWDALNALVIMAEERMDAAGELSDFVADLENRATAQHAPTVEAVTISTLHAAKGLEWEAVFLTGVSEGLLPISLASTPERIEEERRLLYVGVTRAKKYLMISYTQSRSGGHSKRQQSRFLEDLWTEKKTKKVRSRTSARERSLKLKNQFNQDSSPEVLERFEILREWRLTTAQKLSLPAYRIMNDQVLRRIAEIKPETLLQLGLIPGVGVVKIDQYGAQILAVLRNMPARKPSK